MSRDPCGYQKALARDGVEDVLRDLGHDQSRQVRIQTGDQACRDQRARHHLVGRHWVLDRMRVVDIPVVVALTKSSLRCCIVRIAQRIQCQPIIWRMPVGSAARHRCRLAAGAIAPTSPRGWTPSERTRRLRWPGAPTGPGAFLRRAPCRSHSPRQTTGTPRLLRARSSAGPRSPGSGGPSTGGFTLS